MKLLLIVVVPILTILFLGYDVGKGDCGLPAGPYSPDTAPTTHSKDVPNGLGGFVHHEWETICVEPGEVLTLKAEFLPDLKVVIRNHGRIELGWPWPQQSTGANTAAEFVGSSPIPDYNKRGSVLGIRWTTYIHGNILVRYAILHEGSTGWDYRFASLRKG